MKVEANQDYRLRRWNSGQLSLEDAVTFLLHAAAHLQLAHYYHPRDAARCGDCRAIRLLQERALSLAMDCYRGDKAKENEKGHDIHGSRNR